MFAGNRLSQSVALNGGSPAVTNYTYNAANQLTSGSATYDDNGNLTSDGTNSYTWDRANRLLSMGGASYKYDGLNNRVQQTVGANVTKYLLDLQPGLAVVLTETTGANTARNVHAPRGIHAHKDTGGAWEWMVQDGLGSVRGVVDNTVAVLESRNYDPYGELFGATGSNQTSYGFTGEPMDDNGLLYLRARYYNPALGVFTALDPFEGMATRPMSLNGYLYVEGNVPNLVDPSGRCPENPHPLDAFGWRCRYLAEGLATRTGLPVENFMWMDYGQLELLTLMGSAIDVGDFGEYVGNRAAIIPNLLLQNPAVALQAIQQFFSCGGMNSTAFASIAIPLRGAIRLPGILGGLAIVIIGGLTLVGDFGQSRKRDKKCENLHPNLIPCNHPDMLAKEFLYYSMPLVRTTIVLETGEPDIIIHSNRAGIVEPWEEHPNGDTATSLPCSSPQYENGLHWNAYRNETMFNSGQGILCGIGMCPCCEEDSSGEGRRVRKYAILNRRPGYQDNADPYGDIDPNDPFWTQGG